MKKSRKTKDEIARKSTRRFFERRREARPTGAGPYHQDPPWLDRASYTSHDTHAATTALARAGYRSDPKTAGWIEYSVAQAIANARREGDSTKVHEEMAAVRADCAAQVRHAGDRALIEALVDFVDAMNPAMKRGVAAVSISTLRAGVKALKEDGY